MVYDYNILYYYHFVNFIALSIYSTFLANSIIFYVILFVMFMLNFFSFLKVSVRITRQFAIHV
jgi:hypothetical protein